MTWRQIYRELLDYSEGPLYKSEKATIDRLILAVRNEETALLEEAFAMGTGTRERILNWGKWRRMQELGWKSWEWGELGWIKNPEWVRKLQYEFPSKKIKKGDRFPTNIKLGMSPAGWWAYGYDYSGGGGAGLGCHPWITDVCFNSQAACLWHALTDMIEHYQEIEPRIVECPDPANYNLPYVRDMIAQATARRDKMRFKLSTRKKNQLSLF